MAFPFQYFDKNLFSLIFVQKRGTEGTLAFKHSASLTNLTFRAFKPSLHSGQDILVIFSL